MAVCCSLLLIQVLLGAPQEEGQFEFRKLLPAEPVTGQHFGKSLAFDGERALVGAYRTETGGVSMGAAYVFEGRGSSWFETAVLQDPEGREHDGFGLAVQLVDGRALIGAPMDDDGAADCGAVHAFAAGGDGGWVYSGRLLPSDVSPKRQFGYALAGDAGLMVVGAPGDDGDKELAGAVYVFRRSGNRWIESVKLSSPRPFPGERFGSALAVAGRFVFVGVGGIEDAYDPGAVYVFDCEIGRRTLVAELAPPNAAPGGQFGFAIAARESMLLVGAPLADDRAGEAHLFKARGTRWSHVARFTAENPRPKSNFGAAVSVSPGRAFVGAYQERGRFHQSGAVHGFELGARGWRSAGTVVPPDLQQNDRYGVSLAHRGGGLLVGAYQDDRGGMNAGAAYFVRIE